MVSEREQVALRKPMLRESGICLSLWQVQTAHQLLKCQIMKVALLLLDRRGASPAEQREAFWRQRASQTILHAQSNCIFLIQIHPQFNHGMAEGANQMANLPISAYDCDDKKHQSITFNCLAGQISVHKSLFDQSTKRMFPQLKLSQQINATEENPLARHRKAQRTGTGTKPSIILLSKQTPQRKSNSLWS